MIATASMVPAGDFDKTLTGGSSNLTAAQQLLPNKQSIDPTVRTRAASAGQQIIQFIDQVIRSSNYIINQSRVIWNTQTKTWELNGKSAQQFVWYNIVVQTQSLGYDRKRHDNAYRMTFVVTPYEVPMLSTFFAPAQFRGVHKNYNYWFTGQNTQVLNFEQHFNHQWTQAVTNDVPSQISQTQQSNTREQWKAQVFPASGQSSQGAEQRVYESGANAADWLYSTDLDEAKLTIVGDPAWLPSPLEQTIESNFTTAAFYPDGAINTTASGAYFSVGWNRPTDYNLQTGLLDPGTTNYFADRQNGIAGLSREATTYVGTSVTHIFKGGKFTQELSGSIARYDVNAGTDAGRPAKTPTDNQSRVASQLGAFDFGKQNDSWGDSNTRRDGRTNLAAVAIGAANNEVVSGRIGVAEAQAVLANGSERDIQALGGRAYLQSIANSTSAAGTPKAPQTIAKDGGPG